MTVLNATPAWKERRVLVAAAFAVVALVAVILITMMVDADRNQQYVSSLRSDPESRVQGLSDEQLLTSKRLDCEQIADGWTMEEEVEAADRNWSAVGSMSELTESEYQGNVRALFRAAMKTCG